MGILKIFSGNSNKNDDEVLNKVKSQRQIEALKKSVYQKDEEIKALSKTTDELASDGLRNGSSKAGTYLANKKYKK